MIQQIDQGMRIEKGWKYLWIEFFSERENRGKWESFWVFGWKLLGFDGKTDERFDCWVVVEERDLSWEASMVRFFVFFVREKQAYWESEREAYCSSSSSAFVDNSAICEGFCVGRLLENWKLGQDSRNLAGEWSIHMIAFTFCSGIWIWVSRLAISQGFCEGLPLVGSVPTGCNLPGVSLALLLVNFPRVHALGIIPWQIALFLVVIFA